LQSPGKLKIGTYEYAFFVGDRIASPSDIFIKSDREKFVTAGGTIDKIFEYDLTSTGKRSCPTDKWISKWYYYYKSWNCIHNNSHHYDWKSISGGQRNRNRQI
jgi:hypothetical protein